MFSSYQITASFLLPIVYEGANGTVTASVFLVAHQTVLSLTLFIGKVKTCTVTFCF